MGDFLKSLRSGTVLVMDGAMGTELQRVLRAPSLESGEVYNLKQPELIRSIHRSYLDAGADVLLTNTFQANPAALKRRGEAERLAAIWHDAILLAHLDHPRSHYVLADIGPIENLTARIAAGILAECVNVDGVLLETWSSFDGLKRFADRPDLPLLVSFTFHRTKDLRTVLGARPEDCAGKAMHYGAVALGANCGKEIGMDAMLEIVTRYRSACDLPIFVRPNAGTPKRTRSGWRYPRTPAAMASRLPALLEAGVTMVGGCCGTTPEHIRAFRDVVNAWSRRGD